MQAAQTHSAKSIASYSDALSCPVHLESETARLKTAVVHLQGAKDKLEEQIYFDFFRSPSADKLATIQDKSTQIVTKLQEHHKQDLLQVLKHYDAGKKNIQDKFEHFEKFCGLLGQRAHWAEFSHVFGNIGKTEKDNLSKYARQELMVAERVCLDDAQDYQIYALETCYSEMIDNEKQMVEHCQAWLHLCEERKNGALTTLMDIYENEHEEELGELEEYETGKKRKRSVID